jgi:putative membrane protein
MDLLLRWLLYAAALMLVSRIFRGVLVKGFGSALLASLVIGLINVFLKPILQILALPVTLLTLGLFALVVNGFLFWLAGKMLRGYEVRGGCAAIGGAVVYTLLCRGIDRLVDHMMAG